MARQSITFEWHIAEDERRWNNLAEHNDSLAARKVHRGEGERQLVRHLLRTLALLGMTALLVTSSARPVAEQTHLQLQTTVRRLLTLEEEAWQRNDASFYEQLIDTQIGGQWRSEWRTFWSIAPQERTTLGTQLLSITPHGEFVQAQVLVTHPAIEWWRSSPYRELRFYRETATGWVRTMPPADFWGKVRTFETAHLHFEFHEHDRPLVNQIAAQLEQGYLHLYDLLAIKPPSAHAKLNFAIVPESASGWLTSDNRYEISSPTVAKVPNGLTDAEFLAHNIMSRLVYRVMGGDQSSAGLQWRTLQWALSGWLRTEVLGQRAPWHQQAEAAFRAHLQYHWPLQLTAISDWSTEETDDQAQLMIQYMAAESVIAYIVATDGYARLPELLPGLSRYDRWSSFIPAVMDQRLSTFESGWNQYLTDRYGVSLEELVHHDRAIAGGK